MAYTYAIGTDRGKVRANIGDNTAATGATTGFLFEDDEIDSALTEGGSVTVATQIALKRLIAHKALRTKMFRLQGVTLDDRGQVKHLQDLLALYGGNFPSLTITQPAAIPSDDALDPDNA